MPKIKAIHYQYIYHYDFSAQILTLETFKYGSFGAVIKWQAHTV